jgi:hypothetical protein
MTARNLQDEVKKKGLPWSAVKGFDTFTPIGYLPLDCTSYTACSNAASQVFYPQVINTRPS